MVDEGNIRRRFRLIEEHLDERMRRIVAAAEAEALFGGASLVARATGVSRRAIRKGASELQQAPQRVGLGRRIRQPGGGRKRTVERDRTLQRDLETLNEPSTRGNPKTPLRWTCKSVRRLSEELQRMGHTASHRMVADLLHEMGYSLQANAKTIEGTSHPDRNAQFEHINKKVRLYLVKGDPVISVDIN
jgi:transposase